MFKYYLLHRPVDKGTVPNNFIDYINYDAREKIKNTNIEAWGEVYYENRLLQEEIEKYELKEEPTKEEKAKVLEDICKLDEIYEKMINFNPNSKKLNSTLDRVATIVIKEVARLMNDNLISNKECEEILKNNKESEEETL